MPSASFIVIGSLRLAVINSYPSLWLLYDLMTGAALMTAEPNDAKQMTRNELMTTGRSAELPTTLREIRLAWLRAAIRAMIPRTL